MTINIVLVEPQIPQNTGNIARTCASTGSKLHLVKPLGFSIKSKYLKRAGLDYWDKLDVFVYENYDEFIQKNKNKNMYFASTKAVNTYSDISYPKEVYLVFGKETKGLDEKLLFNNKDKCIRIPMLDEIRSLNLSNAVAIVTYEVLRQHDFIGLEEKGKLRNYEW